MKICLVAITARNKVVTVIVFCSIFSTYDSIKENYEGDSLTIRETRRTAQESVYYQDSDMNPTNT